MNDFPTTFPDAGLFAVIGYLRGVGVSKRTAAYGLWQLQGYAMGSVIPADDATPLPAHLPLSAPAPLFSTRAALADELEALHARQSGAAAAAPGGFDWRGLLQKLVPLILSLL